MSEESNFIKIMAVLAATYPRFRLTQETIEAYRVFLKDINLSELEIAARECATRYDFFPSVHEIRAIIGDLRRKAARIPTAPEAWQDLMKAGRGEIMEVKENPGDENYPWFIEKRSYLWLHPLVKKVAEMLGWPHSFPGDLVGVDYAHYTKAYNLAVDKLIQDDMMLPEVRQAIEAKVLQLTGDINE